MPTRAAARTATSGQDATTAGRRGNAARMNTWRQRLRVPREWFIPPLVWVDDPTTGGFTALSRNRSEAQWQALVDTDGPIVTQVDDGRTPPGGIGTQPSSSCSQPSLLLAMLDALDLHSAHRTLEIGTGTGWNAALLAARTGPRGHVTSLDVDPAIADQARITLRRAGFPPHSPHVVHTDGACGHPPDQPYDRIIATASTTSIPRTWIDQMHPGGVLVAPWGTDYSNGALLRMTVQPDGTARGRFGPHLAFMQLRNERPQHLQPHTPELHAAARSSTNRTAREIHEMTTFSRAAFTIGLLVPDCYLTAEQPDHRHHVIELHDTRSRSWARVDLVDDPRNPTVSQLGPRRLWNEVDTAYAWWLDTGRPSPTDYELTITPDGTHFVDLRTPDGGLRWPLAPFSRERRGEIPHSGQW